jgi:transposase
VTKATIHQRLRDEHQVDGSLTSLKRYIALVLSEDAARSKVTVLREDPEPGAEAQIDYGLLGSWLNPASGRSQRVWAFVMVLSHSRHVFVHPVLSMDQASWTTSHVEAFAFFGGVPTRLVPDNLRTGVERPDLYDPKINRSYAELAAHYRTLIDPARARKPKDKPRAERPMQYIRDSFRLGREFSSLEQIRAQALHWCREVAGRRNARPLDGRAPIEVFEQHEAGTLIPLPREVFAPAEWSRVKVSTDIHVKVGKGFYSVPWRLLGQEVDVRTACGRVTDFEHYPPEKIAFHRRTPEWCRQAALADKHDPTRLEAACAKAMPAGDPAYRTILVAGLEAAELPERPGDCPSAPAATAAPRPSCTDPTGCSATSSPSRAPTRPPMTRPPRDRHTGIRALGSTRSGRAAALPLPRPAPHTRSPSSCAPAWPKASRPSNSPACSKPSTPASPKPTAATSDASNSSRSCATTRSPAAKPRA